MKLNLIKKCYEDNYNLNNDAFFGLYYYNLDFCYLIMLLICAFFRISYLTFI